MQGSFTCYLFIYFSGKVSVLVSELEIVWMLSRVWMGSRQPALMEYLHSGPRHHAVGSVLRLQRALGPLGGCLLKMQMLIPYLGFPGGAVVKNLLAMWQSCATKTPWRRKRQLTPGFLLGKSHGPRSLAGYNPRGPRELDTT